MPGLAKAFWILSTVKLASQAAQKEVKKFLFLIVIRPRLSASKICLVLASMRVIEGQRVRRQEAKVGASSEEEE
jgi:hypothetical protein